ncbi:pyridoxal phosphate-dependent aminotransferase [Ectobacillus funiculus]
MQKVNKVMSEGHDVINLGQGNPDQPTPTHIVRALQEAAANPVHHKYPPFRGTHSLKEAVAVFYKREYGVTLDPEKEVAVLFGGKAGLVELPLCFTEPEDTILVPDPGYPDYWSGVALAKSKDEHDAAACRKTAFFLIIASLRPRWQTKQSLCSSTIQTTRQVQWRRRNFFAETAAFANKHNILVCHDFAYGAIGFNGKKSQLASFKQKAQRKQVLKIYTMSKTYNMAGWRIAFAVGNESVIEAINLLQDHMYVSIFGAIQEATKQALLQPQTCVEELVARYESRREALVSACHSIGWDVKAPEGSFFAWLPVPDGYTSQQFADILLEQAHVAFAPGNGFGEHGEGYVRVGLLHTEERLQEAIQRIAKLGIFRKNMYNVGTFYNDAGKEKLAD